MQGEAKKDIGLLQSEETEFINSLLEKYLQHHLIFYLVQRKIIVEITKVLIP